MRCLVGVLGFAMASLSYAEPRGDFAIEGSAQTMDLSVAPLPPYLFGVSDGQSRSFERELESWLACPEFLLGLSSPPGVAIDFGGFEAVWGPEEGLQGIDRQEFFAGCFF